MPITPPHAPISGEERKGGAGAATGKGRGGGRRERGARDGAKREDRGAVDGEGRGEVRREEKSGLPGAEAVASEISANCLRPLRSLSEGWEGGEGGRE